MMTELEQALAAQAKLDETELRAKAKFTSDPSEANSAALTSATEEATKGRLFLVAVKKRHDRSARVLAAVHRDPTFFQQRAKSREDLDSAVEAARTAAAKATRTAKTAETSLAKAQANQESLQRAVTHAQDVFDAALTNDKAELLLEAQKTAERGHLFLDHAQNERDAAIAALEQTQCALEDAQLARLGDRLSPDGIREAYASAAVFMTDALELLLEASAAFETADAGLLELAAEDAALRDTFAPQHIRQVVRERYAYQFAVADELLSRGRTGIDRHAVERVLEDYLPTRFVVDIRQRAVAAE